MLYPAFSVCVGTIAIARALAPGTFGCTTRDMYTDIALMGAIVACAAPTASL